MELLNKNIHVSVFCSTLPLDVRIFNADFISDKNLVQLIVAKAHLIRTPLQNTEQNVHICETQDKPELLFRLLQSIIEGECENKRTILFADENFDVIRDYLNKNGLSVLALKDIVNETQKYILNKFKDRKCNQILLTKSKIFRGPAMGEL
jgi:superfamily II DNA/RNA helicase